jgi:polyphenol oxidase
MLLQYDNTPLVWLQFQLFEPYHKDIIHGACTSICTKKRKPFEGLNVALGLGDDQEHVMENRSSILHSFQKRSLSQKSFPFTLVNMNQQHTDRILSITSLADLQKTDTEPFDALITHLPSLVLMVKHADCQPILIYDPKKRVIAAIHAGWKGIAQKITAKTIAQMNEMWGCNASDLIVGVGPSIGPDDYEFSGWRKELPLFLHTYINPLTGKLDLWSAMREELLSCGVNPLQIEISNLSTYSLPSLFFSYRREGVTGRNATCICLQP